MLEEKEFEKARYFNQLSYDLCKMTPIYDITDLDEKFSELNSEIDRDEIFAIKYHGYVKK